MNTCGIDLKGNEVILVSLHIDEGTHRQLAPEVKKFTLEDPRDQSSTRKLFTQISRYMADQNIDRVAIKERATKGKFAGGAASFKMEGIIQLLEIPVVIINGRTLVAKLKNEPLDFAGVNQYQMDAFRLAYFLSKN